MGICGLLPALSSISKDVHVREYSGLTIAVDIFCWLHRGSIGCCELLVEGKDTDLYATFCLKMLKVLMEANAIPLVVFDGRELPIKRKVNEERRKEREWHKKIAKQALNDGDSALAFKHFKQSISITPVMIESLKRMLAANDIQYITAPYEADAQLAYLSLNNLADVIITEDSDSLVYGCQRVLFKMDSAGNGKEICHCDISKVSNKDYNFSLWTDSQFKLFCCLIGCDYISNIKGVGIKTAYKYASKFRTVAACVHQLMIDYPLVAESAYTLQLEKAMLTFGSQVVLNPTTKQLQHLSPLPYDVVADTDFLGSLEDCHSPLLNSLSLSKQTQEDKLVTGATIVPPTHEMKDHCFQTQWTMSDETSRHKYEVIEDQLPHSEKVDVWGFQFNSSSSVPVVDRQINESIGASTPAVLAKQVVHSRCKANATRKLPRMAQYSSSLLNSSQFETLYRRKKRLCMGDDNWLSVRNHDDGQRSTDLEENTAPSVSRSTRERKFFLQPSDTDGTDGQFCSTGDNYYDSKRFCERPFFTEVQQHDDFDISCNEFLDKAVSNGPQRYVLDYDYADRSSLHSPQLFDMNSSDRFQYSEMVEEYVGDCYRDVADKISCSPTDCRAKLTNGGILPPSWPFL